MKISRLSILSLILAIAVISLGYANPSFADKPGTGECVETEHEHCHDDDGQEVTYSVMISGDVSGNGDNWIGGVGGKNGIGLNDAGEGGGVGELTALTFLTSSTGPFVTDGLKCFGSSSRLIHQAIIKRGRGGRAEASFWFDGKTNDGSDTDVLYALALFGKFHEFNVWPPVGEPHLIIMTDWKIIVENEGKEIKSISCIGESPDDIFISVDILVTKG